MSSNKHYLNVRVPELLKELRVDTPSTFGVMTPHHMVEHLIWITKSTAREYEPVPEIFTESQQGFMNFVKKGAHFRYRHKDIKQEDLQPPRTSSLRDAIEIIPEALARLYAFEPDHIFFNPMMGALNFEEMELFHRKHYEHHLQRQFGLGL